MRRVKPKVIDRDPNSVARGHRIWWLRCEAGLSQRQVAEKAGLSVPSICKLENGDYKSSTLRTLTKVAQAFGVSISYLLGEKSTRTDQEIHPRSTKGRTRQDAT